MADDERMPSLSEWLAVYRSRRSPTEVALYDDPDNPSPDKGFYLFSLDENGNGLTDTWHETVDDAFAQAEYELGLTRADWTAVSGEAQ